MLMLSFENAYLEIHGVILCSDEFFSLWNLNILWHNVVYS